MTELPLSNSTSTTAVSKTLIIGLAAGIGGAIVIGVPAVLIVRHILKKRKAA
jgi:hypothetical protein